jgi:acyl-CoA thioesterase
VRSGDLTLAVLQMLPDAQAAAEAAAGAMNAHDRASRMLGMELISVAPGEASMRMTVREDMLNGYQTCHGGIIFALADSAFAFACNSYNTLSVAAGATIEFLRPAIEGDELTATAREQTRGRRSGLYDVNVLNKRGELIAMFRGRSHQLEGSVTEIVKVGIKPRSLIPGSGQLIRGEKR